jgi:lysozyme
MARHINQAGLDLIKQFEGLRLKSYKCPAGIWTIGYGHTGSDVTPTTKWTKQKAEDALKTDLDKFEKVVENATKTPINDNQFSALVSFVYNVGPGNFLKSTLLKRVRSKQYAKAAEEFLKWCKAGGRVLVGLQMRRKAEKKLFLS